ncbi:MAG: tRNA (adenosine(37)-N6)-dimethylallyltransferase MiaA [Deltaproteobacteria bacterium]|nr:tRNA (adenosine(37)-N6)-dimethylallyltransferase MiaA [Deltaproteobacteria bacterium]
MKSRHLTLAILGPTASGKSAFAIEVAARLGGEIVCLDSSTVYRELDIGTSKPSREERERVRHHLLDVLNPDENFSAYHFVEQAESSITEIASRGKLPIVVGGTYFYLRALQHGMYQNVFVSAVEIEAIENEYTIDETLDGEKMYANLKSQDPAAAEKIHPNDRYRLVRALAILKHYKQKPSELKPERVSPEQSSRLWMKYAMAVSRRVLTNNITRRTETMLMTGLVDEARALLQKYPKTRSLSCIGYNEAARFLSKELTDKQLRNEIIEKTRRLAKRQITWLRSDPEIRYVDSRDLDRVALEVENLKYALETPP